MPEAGERGGTVAGRDRGGTAAGSERGGTAAGPTRTSGGEGAAAWEESCCDEEAISACGPEAEVVTTGLEVDGAWTAAAWT